MVLIVAEGIVICSLLVILMLVWKGDRGEVLDRGEVKRLTNRISKLEMQVEGREELIRGLMDSTSSVRKIIGEIQSARDKLKTERNEIDYRHFDSNSIMELEHFFAARYGAK